MNQNHTRAIKTHIKSVNKHLHYPADSIYLLNCFLPTLQECARFSFFLGHLNESVSCMAGAIKTRWIPLHMKREGGEEVAVNPLALLCLTDSIVLFCFLAAEDSPPRCYHTERGREAWAWATQINTKGWEIRGRVLAEKDQRLSFIYLSSLQVLVPKNKSCKLSKFEIKL